MLVCFNFYTKACHPKYLSKTLEKFKLADGCCFLSEEELEVFLADIRCQLAKDSPVGTKWRVELSEGMWERDGKQIYIDRADRVDSTVARVSVHIYKTVLRWSKEKARFINVYYRLED